MKPKSNDAIGERLGDRFSQLSRAARSTIVALLLGSLLLAGRTVSAAGEAEQPAQPVTSVVRLIVNYGDGVEKHFTRLPWHTGITVLGALEAAQRHPRGIQFEHRGRRATALVTKIDDRANERSGRAWLYRVNGELGDRSCGIAELEVGDTVLWTFENYR